MLSELWSSYWPILCRSVSSFNLSATDLNLPGMANSLLFSFVVPRSWKPKIHTVIGEWWDGKDLEWSGRGRSLILSGGNEDNHIKKTGLRRNAVRWRFWHERILILVQEWNLSNATAWALTTRGTSASQYHEATCMSFNDAANSHSYVGLMSVTDEGLIPRGENR